jgi:hypothetical protein
MVSIPASTLRGLVIGSALALLAGPSPAQTPSGTAGLATDVAKTRAFMVPANNPWVLGTQLAARFAGEGEFASSLLVGTQIIYDIPLERTALVKATDFHLPVAANLGAVLGGLADENRDEQLAKSTSALLSRAQGITFGLHPYGTLRASRNMRWTLFGEAGSKVNSLPPLDSADTRVELIQGRLAAGLETRIGDSLNAARPLTVSAALVGSFFSGRNYRRAFGEQRSNIIAAEFTAILPLQPGTGIVAEAVVADGFRPALRFGILLTPARAAQ